jgi:hypothetical protein
LRIKQIIVLLSLVLAVASVSLADTYGFLPPASFTYQNWSPSHVDLGDVFTANQNFDVTALGYWVGTQTTVTAAEDVGLYSSSGTLIASVDGILPTGPQEDGGYVFANITPVELSAGKTYTVVAYTSGNAWAWGPPSGPVPTNSLITFDYNDFVYTTSLAFTTTTIGASGPNYYGPNFEAVKAPEPGPIELFSCLLGVGALLVGRARRRARG